MAGKLPAMQFYPSDWRKDLGVQSLSYHDRGVWFEMICLMHDSEERGVLILNGQAMSDEQVARLLGLDNQIFQNTLTTLLTYRVASRRESDGAIVCRRMVRDEQIRQTRVSAGKMGGNPILLNQNPTTGVKQKSTPSSSSSSSSSDIKSARTRKRKQSPPVDNLSQVAVPLPLNTPECIAALETWLKYKRERGQPYRETGLAALLAQCAGWGCQRTIEAIQHSMARNYQGIFEDSSHGQSNNATSVSRVAAAPGKYANVGKKLYLSPASDFVPTAGHTENDGFGGTTTP